MKFKVGDKVKLTKHGSERYGHGYGEEGTIHIVERSNYEEEGVCVFNKRHTGWIHKGMGLYKSFEFAYIIHIGGE